MKILYCNYNFYPFRGGAELSMDALLRKLAKKHEVYVMYFDGEHFTSNQLQVTYIKQKTNMPFFFLYLKLREKVLTNLVKKYVKHHKIDIILTSDRISPIISPICEKLGLPLIIFVHGFDLICPLAFIIKRRCTGRCQLCLFKIDNLQSILIYGPTLLKCLVEYPFIRSMMKRFRHSLKCSSAVIANSKFMAKIIKNIYNVTPSIVYPVIDNNTVNYLSHKQKGKYLTFVNPKIHKGAEIIIELASRLKNKQFFIVGETSNNYIHKKLLTLSNIRYKKWTNNMTAVYNLTKILLVPSIFPEPFGRVCVEAMRFGIPCVASNVGALPEVIEDAGILLNNPFDITAWIHAVKYLDNANFYEKLSSRAKKQAKKFNAHKEFKKFLSILNSVTY